MKVLSRLLIASLSAIVCQAVYAETLPTPPLKTQNDKLSYTIGYDLGQDFKDRGMTLNGDILRQGLLDALQGNQRALSEEEMQKTLAAFQKAMLDKRDQALKAASTTNKKAGSDFLAQNKSKPGVQTLPDGVQYKIVKTGPGAKPKASDMVTVEYEGRLINGEIFDKSTKLVTFNVSEVIPGWTEVLQLMPVGSTWEVYIPPEQAYGENGIPHGPIGPNQTLVFTIKLHDIAKPMVDQKTAS
ncbi:MAG: mip [Gammaproteobacteria bacterium]|jgi:FKBP-type peptidyl-prolyl cis-trans isomerase FklB|nr:mip [Gammaproteobacteria bacterium]